MGGQRKNYAISINNFVKMKNRRKTLVLLLRFLNRLLAVTRSETESKILFGYVLWIYYNKGYVPTKFCSNKVAVNSAISEPKHLLKYVKKPHPLRLFPQIMIIK